MSDVYQASDGGSGLAQNFKRLIYCQVGGVRAVAKAVENGDVRSAQKGPERRGCAGAVAAQHEAAPAERNFHRHRTHGAMWHREHTNGKRADSH